MPGIAIEITDDPPGKDVWELSPTKEGVRIWGTRDALVTINTVPPKLEGTAILMRPRFPIGPKGESPWKNWPEPGQIEVSEACEIYIAISDLPGSTQTKECIDDLRKLGWRSVKDVLETIETKSGVARAPRRWLLFSRSLPGAGKFEEKAPRGSGFLFFFKGREMPTLRTVSRY